MLRAAGTSYLRPAAGALSFARVLPGRIMLSGKNFSPQQLSLLTAVLLSVPISIGNGLLLQSFWVAFISLILIFSGSFLLIRFVLDSFIYRKIKLIYKFIYKTKASKKEEMYYKYILPQKSIDDVREDVERWAQHRHNEIETLRNTEQYRREFLQNLAHELRTPIFAIQGYVDTLLDGAMTNTEVNEKFLRKASSNVERMVNLVNDLDAISRLESGEQPLNRSEFTIQPLLLEVFDQLYIKISEQGVKFMLKKGCEQPIAVWADKEKIRQVLVNLISNAAKYGRRGGHIIASVYKIDGEKVLIEIGDDGIGIDEKHLGRLFERFYRTDAGRSRDKGGSGLGLAICKHIVEAHQQNIHVRSKIEVGTTVGFTLQAAARK